jgi:phage shock protein C
VSKDKRDAERAARRAKRLAERAEERASRKESQAERAAERAERLAERVNRRPGREKDLDKSIEDLVDKVTQKAEQSIDDQTKRMFDSPDEEREIKRAESEAEKAKKEARKARKSADQAGRAAEELSEYEESLGLDSGFDSEFEDLFEDIEQPRRRTRGQARKARRKARSGGERHGFTWAYYEWPKSRSKARKRKSAHLYRDRQRKKVCGVCAGVADYVGRPTWEIRLYAVLGLMFIPSVVIPSYFIAYFLMEDKPYYRRVTDRFEEGVDSRDSERNDRKSGKRNQSEDRQADVSAREPIMSNVQAMKTAKDKFSDIEQRLRQMEGHVTSSQFELEREFRKISGED